MTAAKSSLLQWLATFELDGHSPIELKDDAYYNLADGFVCARILNQICPKYFTDDWLEGIKAVPPNGSWRLRVSNLKRILLKIHDFSSDLQSQQFSISAIKPDVAVIAQNFDPDQIHRLIQLILFCAINCDRKEHYIEKIHDLPTQAKHNIKTAIEELLVRDDESNTSYNNQRPNASQIGQNDSTQSETGLGLNLSYRSNKNTSQRSSLLRGENSRLSNDTHQDASSQLSQNSTLEEVRQKLDELLLIKDEKTQACHELELKLERVQSERDQLVFENEMLANKAKQQSTPTSESRRFSGYGRQSEMETGGRSNITDTERNNDIALAQTRKLQDEVHRLKDEIIRLETEKEDYRLKSNLLQEDLDKLSTKHMELRNKAELAKKLQDELDEHKQMSEKVVNYETKLENLVKKNADLKSEFKNLEEKNLANVKTIVRLEEENNHLMNNVNRIEIYKKQLQELQVKLSEETHRADRAELELIRSNERYSITKRDNERLLETTNHFMQGGHGGLKASAAQGSSPTENLGHHPAGGSHDKRHFLGESSGDINDETASISTLDLKEIVARLQVENELMRKRLDSKNENDDTVLSGLLDSANSRCLKLEAENRQIKKKALLMESRLKDLTNSPGGLTGSLAIPSDSSSDNILALMNRVEELQRLLFQREQELIESEAKYKRNLLKAKEVYKSLNSSQTLNSSLHTSCMSSTSSFNPSSLDEANMLKQQLKDREQRLIELEREFSEFKRIKETTPMQRKNAERRLEETSLTSPSNTANSSIQSKHNH